MIVDLIALVAIIVFIVGLWVVFLNDGMKK